MGLVALDREGLRARRREAVDSIADRVDIPTLITDVAKTQQVEATAAVMMLTEDLRAGRRVAPWPSYLAAARDARAAVPRSP